MKNSNNNIFNKLLSKHSENGITVNFDTTVAMKVAELYYGLSEDELMRCLTYAYANNLSVDNKGDVEKIYESIKSKVNVEKHLLLIPINCNLKKRKFHFLERNFIVYTNNSVLKNYKNILFSDFRNTSARKISINTHQKFFIETEVYGKNIYDCIIKIYRDLECLSGMINVVLDRKSAMINFGRKTNEALFDFGTIIYSTTGSESHYLNWNRKTIGLTATRSLHKLEDHHHKNIQKAFIKLDNLSSSAKSFDDLIANSFALYYRSKTSIENENEFAYYWRVCENIIQSENINGNTEKTLKRVLSVTDFGQDFDFEIDILMKKIASIRNNYVHRGDIDFDSYYTSIIGAMANDLIFWIIDNRKSFVLEKDLLNYLIYMNQNNVELSSKIAAISLIQSKRKIRPIQTGRV